MTEYTLIRSARKTVSLSLDRDGQAIVRAPLRYPKAEIDRFVAAHEAWIALHRKEIAARNAFEEANYSASQLALYTERAREILPERVAGWASRMHVQPTGIRITQAKKRFGSCSAKDSLCFSCRVMAYPDDAIDYVIVHELAHIREKNHSARFYRIVAQYLPDWRERESLLRHREEK